MALLLSHLEQISGSARTIGELPFPPSKVFTNAILGNHEITSLIRDTEPHERALFSVDPITRILPQRRADRRTTTLSSDQNRGSQSFNTVPRKHSAVARVLGAHMLQEIEGYGGNASNRKQRGSGGVNVEVLLEGAEKLCAVYPVQGASEKVTMLRNRYKHIAESIAFYEAKVARQTAQLDRMHKNFDVDQSQDKGCEDAVDFSEPQYETEPVTDDELRAEEQTIRDLEQKKHALEERVASMEKDLGGLLGLSN